ncbi:hypothetical protein [Photorhabdus sp. SF281]|uniref:hypothetical protein n=1 Tax=Photorhabdus sp. SF281 TaxID=3459527 RepID=UPI004045134B
MSFTILITVIDANRILAKVTHNECIKSLESIGFKKENGYYEIKFNNEEEKIKILKELNDMGAFFSFGYGWYPSEVMAYLKGQGKIDFRYKVISWKNPNEFEISEY